MSGEALDVLLHIAREAGQLILEVYQRDFAVEFKAPNDPVTEADRRANDFISSALDREFPGVPVVAEESDASCYTGFETAPRVFFVDPLDGTREFVARSDEFVVMIGLLDGARATLGVIHSPVRQVSWAGVVGSGAFRVDSSGARTPIHTSRCAVLESAVVTASRIEGSRAVERAVSHLGVAKLVKIGSAGLKAVAIAEGNADVYAAPYSAGKRWDACAADALVTAAGGRFTDSFGELLNYRSTRLDNEQGVVCAPEPLHGQVLAALKRLGIP